MASLMLGRCVGLVAAGILLALPLLAQGEAPKVPGGVAWTGYRGPLSTGVHQGKPPVSCDEKTGENLRWKIPMPNWGHSQPVVCGNRVFVISEGGWPETQDFPLLQVLDLATGKEVARDTLDHLPATGLSAAEQEASRKAWHDVLADFRANYTLFNHYIYGDEAAKKEVVAKFESLGRKYGGWRGGGYGQLRSLKPKCDDAKAKTAGKAGLTLETWQHGCGLGQSCFGQTFATPVTDGTNVYIATAFGAFFAYDQNGKRLWVSYSPGKRGEYCRNGRSPVIYGDLLLSDMTALARGIDRKTGKVLWSHPVDEETWMTPVVITTGGQDVLLCFNRKAFLLPDGKPLKVEGGTDFGATAVVNYDQRDVVFFTGGGEHGGWTGKGRTETPPPSAVRFALQGDTLTGTVLWSGLNGAGSGHIGILYHDGKLLHVPSGSVFEALTGKLLVGPGTRIKGDGGKRVVPGTGHLLQVAGDRMYGLSGAGGGEGKPGQTATLVCYSLDGKELGKSVFANAPVAGEKKKQIIEQNGWNTWMFSYAVPFTIHGDCILVRSYDYLWCVGK